MLNYALPIAFSVASSIPPVAVGAMIFGVGTGLVVIAAQVLHRCIRTGNNVSNPIPHVPPQPTNQQPTGQIELRSAEEITQQRKADILNNTIKTELEAFLQRCLEQISEKIAIAYTALTRRDGFAAEVKPLADADNALRSSQQKQQKGQQRLAEVEQAILELQNRIAGLKEQYQELEGQDIEGEQNKQQREQELSELQQSIALNESRLQFLEVVKTKIQAKLQKTASQLSQAEQQRLYAEAHEPALVVLSKLDASAAEASKRVWQEINIRDYLTSVKNGASKLIDGEYTVTNLIDTVTRDVFDFSIQYNQNLGGFYAALGREIPAIIEDQHAPGGPARLPDALKRDHNDLLQKFQALLALADKKADRNDDEISKKFLNTYLEVRLQLISCKSTEQFLDRQQQQDNQWFDEIEQFISQQANMPAASPANTGQTGRNPAQ